MNFKKYLQKQAEKEAEALLTEEDRQFCKQLADNVEPAPVPVKRNKVTLWASLSSAIAVALVAVIVLPVVLTNRTPPVTPPVIDITYKEEFVDSKTCLLEDVNNGSKCFVVEQSAGYSCTENLYYDTISNDTLFYSVKVNALYSEYYIYVVTNNNYKLEFEIEEELNSEQLTDYEIKYQSVVADRFSGTQTGYKGVITLNEEIVYIDYMQTVDLGEYSKDAFFEDIQSVLKVK